jgi:hypothetical protein
MNAEPRGDQEERQYVDVGPYLPIWDRSRRLRNRALITHPEANFTTGKVGQLEPECWYRWEDDAKDQTAPRKLFEVTVDEIFCRRDPMTGNGVRAAKWTD